MTATIHSDILDNGLLYLRDGTHGVKTTRICKTQPTTYTEATTAPGTGNNGLLGTKTWTNVGTDAIGAPAAGTGTGRKVATTAITDGSITTTDTAAWWALTSTADTKLLVTQALSSSQAVTSGNTFTLASADIQLSGP